MKVQSQFGMRQKRASRAVKAFMLLAILLLVIGTGVFFGGVYLVQELFFFVGLAALLAFFVANLVVLGILFQSAARSILWAVRKSRLAAREEIQAEGAPVPLEAGQDRSEFFGVLRSER